MALPLGLPFGALLSAPLGDSFGSSLGGGRGSKLGGPWQSHVPRYSMASSAHRHGINGHDSGTDWLHVPTICQAYFLGLCKGISPQNMAWNMVITYLHFRILKFPSMGFHNFTTDTSPKLKDVWMAVEWDLKKTQRFWWDFEWDKINTLKHSSKGK